MFVHNVKLKKVARFPQNSHLPVNMQELLASARMMAFRNDAKVRSVDCLSHKCTFTR